jgi:hypothetical protein
MSIPSSFSAQLSMQSQMLPPQVASRLLNESILTEVKRPRGGLIRVSLTVSEIYKAIKNGLRNCFDGASVGSCRALESLEVRMVGSSVAALFSDEPFFDVDIHAVVDLSAFEITQRYRQWHNITWAVAGGLRELIISKMGDEGKEGLSFLSSEHIFSREECCRFFEEGRAPFNVKTFSLGSRPVEITCKGYFDKAQVGERTYDFNSGSLALCLDEAETVVISTQMPDLQPVIEQIRQRQLSCVDPQSLNYKGMARYLFKLILSGYHDPEIETLRVFLQKAAESVGPRLDISAQGLLDELCALLDKKNMQPAILYCALWVMQDDHPLFKKLSRQAKYRLEEYCKAHPESYMQKIGQLVETRCLAEVCWHLLLQAQHIQLVTHRSEPSLKLQLPLFPLFSTNQTDLSAYFLVPLKYLLLENVSANFLFFEQPFAAVDPLDASTKEALQRFFSKFLKDHNLLVLDSAIQEKFQLDIDPAFAKDLVEHLNGLLPSELENLPQAFLIYLEKVASEHEKLHPILLLSLVKKGLEDRGPANSLVHAGASILVGRIWQLLQPKIFQSLNAEQQYQIFSCVQRLVCDLQVCDEQAVALSEKIIKTLINILYAGVLENKVGLTQALLGASLIQSHGRIEQVLAYARVLIKTFYDDHPGEVLGFLLNLAQHYPLQIARFLDEPPHLKLSEAHIKQLIHSLKEAYQKDGDAATLDQLLAKGKSGLDPSTQDLWAQDLFVQSVADSKSISMLLHATLASWPIHPENWVMQLNFSNEMFAAYLQLPIKALENDDPNMLQKLIRAAYEHHLFDKAYDCQKKLSYKDPAACMTLMCQLPNMPIKYQIELLCVLIQSYPDLITHADYLRSCRQALDVLHAQENKFEPQRVFTAQDPIMRLHKHIVMDTIDHPYWAELWQNLCLQPTRFSLWDFIEPAALSRNLLDIQHVQHLNRTLVAFEWDVRCLEMVICALQDNQLAADEIFYPLVLKVARKSESSIWSENKIAIKRGRACSEYLLELNERVFNQLLNEPEMGVPTGLNISNPRRKAQLSLYQFVARYGDQRQLRAVIEKITGVNPESADGKGILNEGWIDAIIKEVLSRALDEKDEELICQLHRIYLRQISPQSRGVTLSRTQAGFMHESKEAISSFCERWGASIKEVGAGKGFAAHGADLSPAFISLKFYFQYLSDMTLSIEMALKDTTLTSDQKQHLIAGQDVIFKHFDNLLDYMIKRKETNFLVVIETLVGYFDQLSEKHRLTFTQRVLQLASATFKGLPKIAKVSYEAATALLAQAVHSCAICIESCDRSEIANIKSERVIAVLKDLREACNLLSIEDYCHNDLLDQIAMIETLLSKEALEKFFKSWMEEILARKDAICSMELTQFTYFMIKFDSRSQRMINLTKSKEQVSARSFINSKYFISLSFLQNFTGIIEILFDRFSKPEDLQAGLSQAAPISFYHLFKKYAYDIYLGGMSLKVNADRSKFFQDFLEKIQGALQQPMTDLTPTIVSSIYQCLLLANDPANAQLLQIGKKDLKKSARLFMDLIRVGKDLPPEFYSINGLFGRHARTVYDRHKLELTKIFSVEEISELIAGIDLINAKNIAHCKLPSVDGLASFSDADMSVLLGGLGLAPADILSGELHEMPKPPRVFQIPDEIARDDQKAANWIQSLLFDPKGFEQVSQGPIDSISAAKSFKDSLPPLLDEDFIELRPQSDENLIKILDEFPVEKPEPENKQKRR